MLMLCLHGMHASRQWKRHFAQLQTQRSVTATEQLTTSVVFFSLDELDCDVLFGIMRRGSLWLLLLLLLMHRLRPKNCIEIRIESTN